MKNFRPLQNIDLSNYDQISKALIFSNLNFNQFKNFRP